MLMSQSNGVWEYRQQKWHDETATHVPEKDVWNFTLHEKQMHNNIFKIAFALMDLRNEKKLLLSFC